MTKVDRLYYEEMRKAVEDNTAQVTEQVTKQVTGEVTYTIATNMLESGDTIEKVSKNTGLPLDDVRKLYDSIRSGRALGTVTA